jgi:hypothetical protein
LVTVRTLFSLISTVSSPRPPSFTFTPGPKCLMSFLPGGATKRPFTDADYVDFVDGKPRTDGVRSFLHSRGIDLPEGEPDDPVVRRDRRRAGGTQEPAFSTRCSNATASSPTPARSPCSTGWPTPTCELAIVSSSRNARQVLDAAGLLDRFEVIVDGNVGADAHLPGKPAPDYFLHAASQVGCAADRRRGSRRRHLRRGGRSRRPTSAW